MKEVQEQKVPYLNDPPYTPKGYACTLFPSSVLDFLHALPHSTDYAKIPNSNILLCLVQSSELNNQSDNNYWVRQT